MTLRITPGRALCASVTALVLNASADAQGRVHRTNLNLDLPTKGPFERVNGELPVDLSNWPHPAGPDGNLFPRSTAAIADRVDAENKRVLGKLVFWDEQISSGKTTSCGTCHAMRAGGTDVRPGPGVGGTGGTFGVIRQHAVGTQVRFGFLGAGATTNIGRQFTPVAAPTMIGAYVFNLQFWDGRSGPALDNGAGGLFGGGTQGVVGSGPFADFAALEDQAHEPPVNTVEMGHELLTWSNNFIQQKLNNLVPLDLCDPATIPADLQAAASGLVTYQTLFDFVFQNNPTPGIGGLIGVTRERIAMAIATYERTLIPDQAPIDIPNGMTLAQVRGFEHCRQAGCFGCHSITGTPNNTPLALQRPLLDAQRRLVDAFDNPFTDGEIHGILLPGAPNRKTPTLRNVGLHKRFFSTGQFTTRLQLMNFYDNPNRGGPLGFGGFNGPGTSLTPAQRIEVEDFLFNALTDPRVASETFPFDRPQLASERLPFEANEYGASTPANGPEIIADSPPQVPRPNSVNSFKIGVGNAAPNSPAFLFFSLAPAAGPVDWIAQPFIGVAAPNTNAQGITTSNVPFVMDQSGIGVTVFTQWLILAPTGLNMSDAASFLMFQ